MSILNFPYNKEIKFFAIIMLIIYWVIYNISKNTFIF